MTAYAAQAEDLVLPEGWVWADREALAREYAVPNAFQAFSEYVKGRLGVFFLAGDFAACGRWVFFSFCRARRFIGFRPCGASYFLDAQKVTKEAPGRDSG